MGRLSANTLETDLKTIAQNKIRGKGNIKRVFRLNVYNNADDTSKYRIDRNIYYNFGNVTIDNIPDNIGVSTGDKITADSVLRIKDWLIGNVVDKWKSIMAVRQTIDGRV